MKATMERRFIQVQTNHGMVFMVSVDRPAVFRIVSTETNKQRTIEVQQSVDIRQPKTLEVVASSVTA